MNKEWYSNWECDDEIICPYCGKKYEPSYEDTYIGHESVDCYEEGEQGEFTCDELCKYREDMTQDEQDEVCLYCPIGWLD